MVVVVGARGRGVGLVVAGCLVRKMAVEKSGKYQVASGKWPPAAAGLRASRAGMAG